MTTSLSLSAQKLIVYRISGKAEVVGPTGNHPLQARAVLTPSSVIIVGYDSQVSVYDEKAMKQYIFRAVGRHKVAEMLKDKKNTTVVELTARYLHFIKTSVFSKGGVAALTHNSDPATVTRDVDEVLLDSLERFATLPPSSAGSRKPRQSGRPFQDEFAQARQDYQETFDSFRRQCASEYANFARLAWEEMGITPPTPQPADQPFAPVAVPRDEPQKVGNGVSVISVVGTPVATASTIVDYLKEAVATHDDCGVDPLVFTLFDTEFALRYPKALSEKLKMREVAENHVADVIDVLLLKDYDNLLHDCLQARRDHELCDWAYYQLLRRVGRLVCPESEDCAVAVTAFLYAESGYNMRLAIIDGSLHMFVATPHTLYDRNALCIDGQNYTELEAAPAAQTALVCATPLYAEEHPLSLVLLPHPRIGGKTEAQKRTIASTVNTDLSVAISVPQGLLEFYETYPASYVDDNYMTRWALYANTPLAPEVSAQLYPALREYLAPLTKAEAAERLLRWVQTGLTYKTDEEVWGGDRVFFAEETLHYPACDCEDRAILYTRLVRDLLGLQCVLVHYPNHIACGVRFEETVSGDYVEFDGQRYIIADPAFIPARLGMTMDGKDNASAVLILLQNQ